MTLLNFVPSEARNPEMSSVYPRSYSTLGVERLLAAHETLRPPAAHVFC